MPKTILVVEDARSMRGLVAITLGNAGYMVVEASDGVDALEKITRQKVHLMICDVNMPRMDGLELLKTLKKQPRYKHIPAVMLTTVSDDGKKREGQAVGAKAWIVKPFKPDTILKVVRKIIG